MKQLASTAIQSLWFLLPILVLGCEVLTPGVMLVQSSLAPQPVESLQPAPRAESPELQRTCLSSGDTPEPAASGPDELSVEVLVQEVLARNPSLAQMAAAWQAAQARYPQVTSLDDPMLNTKIGPGSIGSNHVDFACMVEVSQKYSWCGKRKLRGDNALAEADAAGRDVDDIRLQLIESARSTFYDYYLVERALAVNADNLRLLREFRQNAATRYRTGLVSEQDVLQADVEIGREQERRLTLEEMRQIAVARLNTLLHQPPDQPLPPPPQQAPRPEALPQVELLRTAALAQRPDLQALADHIRAEEANLALAHKECCPDFEVAATYDAFWQERELRPALSLKVNLPVRTARRCGAIAEAEARIRQRRAELDKQIDQVHFQVQEAYEKVSKSGQAIGLYEGTILPAAQANVKAAQSAYVTGKIPFVSLLEAERNQVGLRERYYEAVADYFRRRATLERVIGGPLAALSERNQAPPCPAAARN